MPNRRSHSHVSAALALVALLGGCAGSPVEGAPSTAGATTSAAKPAIRDVDVATLKADMEAGRVPVLYDVRTPGEYAGGHVEGAILLPVSELQARVGELEKWRGQPVYLICASGGRSAAAARILAEKGFSAVNVQGGTSAWVAAGHPTVK